MFDKIVECFWSVSPLIRNEMLLQLIIYTSHPLKEERLKAWQLFAIVANYINIEDKFHYYILNFIYNTHTLEANSFVIQNYTAFAIVNFVKNRNLDDRQVKATVSDIKQIIKLKKKTVQIYFTQEKFLELKVELYENFEEIKYRVFKLFSFPSELLPHLGFYEVVESNLMFDETFIEEFVRVVDVLATWDVKKTRQESQTIDNKIVSTKIFFKFRYYLRTDDSSLILRKIEKCFLIAEFFRLIYCNRIKLSSEEFIRAMAILVRFKYVSIGNEELANLIKDAKEVLHYYGHISNNAIRFTFKQVLSEVKTLEVEKAFSLKNNLVEIMKSTPVYRSQFFRIRMDPDTVMRYFVPINVLLLVSPTGINFLSSKFISLFFAAYETIRTVLLNADNVHIIFNLEEPKLVGNKEDNNPAELVEDNKDNFVKFVTYSFQANQASSVYQTIQNYISLQMNGMYKVSKIKSQRVYLDLDNVKITEQQIKIVTSESQTVYSVNRFFKKDM